MREKMVRQKCKHCGGKDFRVLMSQHNIWLYCLKCKNPMCYSVSIEVDARVTRYAIEDTATMLKKVRADMGIVT